jgi:adenylate kinase
MNDAPDMDGGGPAIKVIAPKPMHRRTMAQAVSLTGTPGTGKSTIAKHLASSGWEVLDLTELARRSGAIVGRDEDRQTDEVDMVLLVQAVKGVFSDLHDAKRVLQVGHMSHLVPCHAVVVLRCSPSVLKARLLNRGWPEVKVQENVEAEAVGVVLVESMELEPPVPVYELDTTSEAPERTAERLMMALNGEAPDLGAGWVDWSEEVMEWY